MPRAFDLTRANEVIFDVELLGTLSYYTEDHMKHKAKNSCSARSFALYLKSIRCALCICMLVLSMKFVALIEIEI